MKQVAEELDPFLVFVQQTFGVGVVPEPTLRTVWTAREQGQLKRVCALLERSRRHFPEDSAEDYQIARAVADLEDLLEREWISAGYPIEEGR